MYPTSEVPSTVMIMREVKQSLGSNCKPGVYAMCNLTVDKSLSIVVINLMRKLVVDMKCETLYKRRGYFSMGDLGVLMEDPSAQRSTTG
jgi:hypothetical protein